MPFFRTALTLGLGLSLVSSAFGCSCAPPPPLEDCDVGKNQAALLVKVTERTEFKCSQFEGNAVSDVEIVKVFKDNTDLHLTDGEEVTISSSLFGNLCGYNLAKGEQYIVFAGATGKPKPGNGKPKKKIFATATATGTQASANADAGAKGQQSFKRTATASARSTPGGKQTTVTDSARKLLVFRGYESFFKPHGSFKFDNDGKDKEEEEEEEPVEEEEEEKDEEEPVDKEEEKEDKEKENNGKNGEDDGKEDDGKDDDGKDDDGKDDDGKEDDGKEDDGKDDDGKEPEKDKPVIKPPPKECKLEKGVLSTSLCSGNILRPTTRQIKTLSKACRPRKTTFTKKTTVVVHS